MKNNKLHRFFYFVCSTLFCFGLSSQIKYESSNTVAIAGISLSAGTHVNQLGFFIRSITRITNHVQWNNELRISVYLRNLGPKKSHLEAQWSTGPVFGYGKTWYSKSNFLYKNSNLTGYQHSASYNYNLYFNTIRTSQQTGTLSLSFGDFYLSHENDLLARPRLDRFRTAAIQIAYQVEKFRFSITQNNWTGMLGKSVKDSTYPSPAGYLDTTANRYGLISHGILSISGEYLESAYLQQMKLSAGADAEQIRHCIQNRVVHDGCLLPSGWRNQNNFHLPMIDSNGHQYLFRKDQKIKKPRIYLNAFLNSDIIY